MVAQREESLRTFVLDADIIIHEAGVPPIHTDLSYLNDLPVKIKKKMQLVHTSHIPETIEKTVEGKKVKVKVKDLKIPETGLENTLILPVNEHNDGYFRATRRFQILCDTFYFRNLSPAKLFELFCAMEDVLVSAGTTIFRAGDESGPFYLIESGLVEIYRNDEKVATLTAGDSFGESALWSERIKLKRSATTIAKTDARLLTISKKAFLEGVEHPYIDADLKKVTRYRPFLAQMLAKTPLFKSLTRNQIEDIATMIEEECHFKKGSPIIHQGDRDASLFLIKEGSVRLERSDGKVVSEFMRLGPGDTFGEMSLLTRLPRTATAIAQEDCIILELKRESFEKILNKYQNIHYNIVSLVEQRLEETKRLDEELKKKSQRQSE
jgi:CRP-like cAMP-binding protein